MSQYGDVIGRERRQDKVARQLRATVIDDEDVVHVRQHAFDDRDNVSPHAETGYDRGQPHARAISGVIPRSRRNAVAHAENSAKLTE